MWKTPACQLDLCDLMQENLTLESRKEFAMTKLALEAQAALLPHALATFAICLPIFVWGGSHAGRMIPRSDCFLW